VVPGNVDVVVADVTFVRGLVVVVVVEVVEVGNVSFDVIVVVVTVVVVVISANAASSVYCILYAVHKKSTSCDRFAILH